MQESFYQGKRVCIYIWQDRTYELQKQRIWNKSIFNNSAHLGIDKIFVVATFYITISIEATRQVQIKKLHGAQVTAWFFMIIHIKTRR